MEIAWLNPEFLIYTLGLLGITTIVFAESGLFFGFFFPGDSLLFTAGFFASLGYLNIYWLVSLCVAAAILGDNVGYWFGAKVGPELFSRPESRWFKPAHLQRTKIFFERHGKQSVVLARFVPIIRTFTPILAGAGKMRYPTFLRYNIIGGIIWGGGLPTLGFWLGRAIPNIDHFLWPIIGTIIILSFLPALGYWRR